VPFAWSVTAPRVPRVVARVTGPPLTDRLVPLASLAWTVMVEVEVPLAVIAVGTAEMVVFVGSAGPTAVITTGVAGWAAAVSLEVARLKVLAA
jgi:hypothetical protein